MLALVSQAPAVARIRVGKSSERWAPNAGVKANEPIIDTKIPAPISQGTRVR
jgi:hypothetical protein